MYFLRHILFYMRINGSNTGSYIVALHQKSYMRNTRYNHSNLIRRWPIRITHFYWSENKVHIFKYKNRNIYQLSSWSTGTAFEQVIPLQLEHARVHCKLFLRHLHLLGVRQPVSQPQWIVSKRHSGAAGLVIMTGRSWLFIRWNPYNKGSRCTPSHSCTWRKALRECWYPVSDVGGSFSGDM